MSVLVGHSILLYKGTISMYQVMIIEGVILSIRWMVGFDFHSSNGLIFLNLTGISVFVLYHNITINYVRWKKLLFSLNTTLNGGWCPLCELSYVWWQHVFQMQHSINVKYRIQHKHLNLLYILHVSYIYK